MAESVLDVQPKPSPQVENASISESSSEPEPIKIDNGVYWVNLNMPAITQGVHKYTAEAVTLEEGDEEVGTHDFSYKNFTPGDQVIRLVCSDDAGEKIRPQTFWLDSIQYLNRELKPEDFQPITDGEVVD